MKRLSVGMLSILVIVAGGMFAGVASAASLEIHADGTTMPPGYNNAVLYVTVTFNGSPVSFPFNADGTISSSVLWGTALESPTNQCSGTVGSFHKTGWPGVYYSIVTVRTGTGCTGFRPGKTILRIQGNYGSGAYLGETITAVETNADYNIN